MSRGKRAGGNLLVVAGLSYPRAVSYIPTPRNPSAGEGHMQFYRSSAKWKVLGCLHLRELNY